MTDKQPVVFIVSPQAWDGFQVSKHHYAIELAKRGASVYFLDNTVDRGRLGGARVMDSSVHGIKIVRHMNPLRRWLKFHARGVYDRLSHGHIRDVVNAVGVAPDIIWDFDNNYHFHDLSLFGAKLAIFHPVDSLQPDFTSDKNADVTMAVSKLFLDALDTKVDHKMVVPHGLNPVHALYGNRIVGGEMPTPSKQKMRPRVGYVANLDIVGIDWPVILELVRRFTNVDFLFIGPYGKNRPRVGAVMPTKELIDAPNVRLTGRLSIADVVREADDVDIWLMCNDRKVRPDGSVNAHKLLEYLATGKAVLSNAVDAFANNSLVNLAPVDRNDLIPDMLGDMLSRVAALNTQGAMQRRAAHALEYSYVSNLDNIADFLRANDFPADWALGAAENICKKEETA